MAQSSLRASQILGSDSATFCDICLVDQEVSADCYCTVCNQHLCQSCRSMHQRVSTTKSHRLLTGSALFNANIVLPSHSTHVENSSTSEENPKCRDHRGMDIKYFCEDHDTACCEKCKMFEHRNCGKKSIADVAMKPTIQVGNSSTLKSLKDLLDEVKGLKCAYDNDLQAFTNHKNDISKAVEIQHMKIDNVVKKWDDSLMDAVENSYQEKSKVMSDHDDIFAEMITTTEEKVAKLDIAIKSSDMEAIVCASGARKDIKKYKDMLKDIEREMFVVKMKLDVKEPARKLSECLEDISQLKITKQGDGKKPQLIFPGDTNIRNRLYADRMAIEDGTICVESTSDTEVPGITGIEVLQDGTIMMCDIFNMKLKLYDANFHFLSEKIVSSRPWRMSLTSISREVVVTLPDENSLQLANAESTGKINIGKKINLNSMKSFFVNQMGDKFLVDKFTRAGCGMVVLDRNGTSIREIRIENLPRKFLEGSFVYSCMNDDQSIVYFTHDKGGCCGISMANGNIVFQYEDNRDDAYCAYSGVTTDLDGNVYVGGLQTENVIQLNGNGKKIKTLVDGVQKLLYIKFANSRRTLFVKQKETGFVTVYQLV